MFRCGAGRWSDVEGAGCKCQEEAGLAKLRRVKNILPSNAKRFITQLCYQIVVLCGVRDWTVPFLISSYLILLFSLCMWLRYLYIWFGQPSL